MLNYNYNSDYLLIIIKYTNIRMFITERYSIEDECWSIDYDAQRIKCIFDWRAI